VIEYLTSFWLGLPESLQYTIYTLLKVVVILVPLFIVVAYYTLAERKIIGYMQVRKGPNRVGPKGLFQPFADMFKLMFKEIILPTNSNKYLFFIAPVLVFAPAMAQCRLALYSGNDLGRCIRRYHRRLGIQFQICPAGCDAFGCADSFL